MVGLSGNAKPNRVDLTQTLFHPLRFWNDILCRRGDSGFISSDVCAASPQHSGVDTASPRVIIVAKPRNNNSCISKLEAENWDLCTIRTVDKQAIGYHYFFSFKEGKWYLS
jgi:hypothetical protein